jgi:hypothetical protein
MKPFEKYTAHNPETGMTFTFDSVKDLIHWSTILYSQNVDIKKYQIKRELLVDAQQQV